MEHRIKQNLKKKKKKPHKEGDYDITINYLHV